MGRPWKIGTAELELSAASKISVLLVLMVGRYWVHLGIQVM